MYAYVKKVRKGTRVNSGGIADTFVYDNEGDGMNRYIGKRISVRIHSDSNEWYYGKGFRWHKSWLRFSRPKKR